MSELKRKKGDNFQQYAVTPVKPGSGITIQSYPISRGQVRTSVTLSKPKEDRK